MPEPENENRLGPRESPDAPFRESCAEFGKKPFGCQRRGSRRPGPAASVSEVVHFPW